MFYFIFLKEVVKVLSNLLSRQIHDPYFVKYDKWLALLLFLYYHLYTESIYIFYMTTHR